MYVKGAKPRVSDSVVVAWCLENVNTVAGQNVSQGG